MTIRFVGLLLVVVLATCRAGAEAPDPSAAMHLSFEVRVEPSARDDGRRSVALFGDEVLGIGLEPSGAWSCRIRNAAAEVVLDYTTTVPRQRIDDGRWHRIGVTLDVARSEVRFRFNGRAVAVYSAHGIDLASITAGLAAPPPDALIRPSSGEAPAFRIRAVSRTAARPGPDAAHAVQSVMPSPAIVSVMAFNIWRGGREDGAEIGVQRTIDVIRAADPDIVCMQETYGSGPRIADALGYHFYLRSSNLSVMSRYPIEETFDLYQPFRFGACRVRLGRGASVIVCPLWIHHLPDVWGDPPTPETDMDALIAAEMETRGSEIRGILDALQPWIDNAAAEPVIVAGDFNSMSHLDWSEAYRHLHGGVAVDWPVSRAMTDAGFRDTFREAHPDVEARRGITWSPRFRDALQTRIDYVYVLGDRLRTVDAVMLDRHPVRWPSDHAAVLSTLRWVE